MAGEPTIGLTVTPASPHAGDGVLFKITGPAGGTFVNAVTKVAAHTTAKLQVKDPNGKVRVESPAFVQKNRLAVIGAIVSIVPAGIPDGGYLVLSAKVRQPYNPANPESAVDRGYDQDLGSTAHIVYDASDDAVSAACAAAWGTGVVSVSDGPLAAAAVTLNFGNGPFDRRAVTVLADSHLTAEGGPVAVTVTEETAGGVEVLVAGGPNLFGPVQFPVDYNGDPVVYSPDVVYDYVSPDDDSGVVAGDSLFGMRPFGFTVTAE